MKIRLIGLGGGRFPEEGADDGKGISLPEVRYLTR
jgi:hypothetical protein